MIAVDPRAAVATLADGTRPYLLGVRHHSPALAAVIPALLDAAAPDVVCVELPADFQRWLPHLAAPGTVAPVALAGAQAEGGLGFYPFADFSPELAALRWARDHDVPVLCCDLPLGDPGWSADEDHGSPSARVYADALQASATGREGDDLWDRSVEVRAPGCAPEEVRRAALSVGWALRTDSEAGGVGAVNLAREAHMRAVLRHAASDGRRAVAVVGSFHAAALTEEACAEDTTTYDPAKEAGEGTAVTSLVPYAFDLLDSRSGYPAGIRDPRWQQSVFRAGGDPGALHEAAARAITDVCRALRGAGHTAGTGEAAETLRVAGDLASLRGLPAPGRGELVEGVTTVLGQGETLGRGRALAKALETVLVGTDRGRTAPGTPRSGLGPSVEAELEALRLPGPHDPETREIRLDPLRSDLDRRREILLQRLTVCGVGYASALDVAGTGDAAALTTKWKLSWTPSVAARLDLAGVRGVTAAQAAAGTLAEAHRRENAEGGATSTRVLAGLEAAARCDLPDLVEVRLEEAAEVLPSAATLPELIAGLDLTEGLRRGHLPGTTEPLRERAAALGEALLETAVQALPGLAGGDRPEDAAAVVELAVRAAEHRVGLRMRAALDFLAREGSPLMQGAALAVRVLLELEDAPALGARVAGWVDGATNPEGRRALARRLRGLLTAAGPLLQSAAAALDPLLDRVDDLPDSGFLARLPALRDGFEALSPAARGRLLDTVAERLGERVSTDLDAPAELLAQWTAADVAAMAALRALGLAPPEPSPVAEAAEETEEREETETQEAAEERPVQGIVPADRWRLLLGRQREQLSDHLRRHATALDELYGAGRGEGAADFGAEGQAPSQGGGKEAAFPTAREWADELEALFGADVREEVLAEAVDAGRTDVLTQLDPASVRPSVELLTSVLSLAGGMPEQQLAKLRPLVRRLVDELAKEMATRLRPALTGLANPRPTYRPGGPLDLARTLRANLAHTRTLEDGRTIVVPEKPVFATRSQTASDWRLILLVDVSGSMEASVIWSALTAAVLGGVPTLSTHFLAFSTEVIDLTDRVSDPLSLLLEVRVGGGTHIAKGLAHARGLVTVPTRTLVVTVSDFEEGYSLGGLLGEVRQLTSSGVHLLGCAALDDTGKPRYSLPVARQLAAAGMPVAALSPLALARWVGERLRGETR
ncbi:VWA domain containing CoxE-like protein [Actinocorallia herbida]|uniref:VWA domain containing CoxE-like protein n=1 Tax=Actinocorallia herbida TaxID=58109 RepID=A0A3N1D800_9ACTN|nr:DUF5682 family protein [Actinocorallia herbida]ROO89650.1 VWA domain containing CoxE-like protein [Actinocorallia herbida]